MRPKIELSRIISSCRFRVASSSLNAIARSFADVSPAVRVFNSCVTAEKISAICLGQSGGGIAWILDPASATASMGKSCV
jgi:hypothetical protein